MLHLLALWLVRRRAMARGREHVVIPPDLSRRQYVFVAALPGACFVLVAGVGLALAALGGTVPWFLAGCALMLYGMVGAASAAGDLALIAERLNRPE
jgi:hypothetical protein